MYMWVTSSASAIACEPANRTEQPPVYIKFSASPSAAQTADVPSSQFPHKGLRDIVP